MWQVCLQFFGIELAEQFEGTFAFLVPSDTSAIARCAFETFLDAIFGMSLNIVQRRQTVFTQPRSEKVA